MKGTVQVEHLSVRFPTPRGELRALDDVSLQVPSGRTVAIVGESGCGKSTLAKCLVGLVKPTTGRVFIEGIDVSNFRRKDWRPLRSAVQLVFQDPFSSLNPKRTIGQSLEDAVRTGHQAGGSDEAIAAVLRLVGLSPESARKYPHEFSGGQRQRIGIARAVCGGARTLVCDEPVSALDVSVRGQVINLLLDLQARRGLSYVFISHDLAVVQAIADEVVVMYLGTIVETADRDDFWRSARHPYTEALLASAPDCCSNHAGERTTLRGDVPSALTPPSGCPFHPRCRSAREVCRSEKPTLTSRPDGTKRACHIV